MTDTRITAALGIAFRNQGKEVLLTQRWAPDSPTHHLKWQVPGGGQEFGETIQQTLEREFLEELQLRPTLVSELAQVRETIITSGQDQLHISLIGFVVTVPDQDPDISGDDETHAWKWWKISELDTLEMLDHTKEFVIQGLTLVHHSKSQVGS